MAMTARPEISSGQLDDALLETTGSRMWRRFWGEPLSIAGVAILAFLVAFCFLGPLVWRVNPTYPYILHTMSPPSAQFPLGTDGLGHDQLSSLMIGGQISLEVGFAAAVVSMVIGTVYGMISGLVGGSVDMVMMRIVDVLLSLPTIFLLLFLDATFQPSAILLVVVLSSVSWFGVSRLVRAEVLSIKEREYVEAARALGASPWRIMRRQLVPNFLGTVLVAGTFQIADSILGLAGLSFLGLGLPPPNPNWGATLSTGMSSIFQNAYWLIYPAGVCILLVELAVNFIGDGMRAAFDTQLK